jgi:hypothetical protein
MLTLILDSENIFFSHDILIKITKLLFTTFTWHIRSYLFDFQFFDQCSIRYWHTFLRKLYNAFFNEVEPNTNRLSLNVFDIWVKYSARFVIKP